MLASYLLAGIWSLAGLYCSASSVFLVRLTVLHDVYDCVPYAVTALPLLQLLPTGPGTRVWWLQFVSVNPTHDSWCQKLTDFNEHNME
jgi:hypothetical protein